MKIKPDFKAKTAYDWKYFTKEDYTMYKDILLAELYNPELAEFFYEQKKKSDCYDWRQKKHFSGSEPIDEITPHEPSAEDMYLLHERMEQLLPELDCLSKKEIERLYRVHVYGESYREIARDEKVSAKAVEQCVKKAIIKLRRRLNESDYD